MLSFLMLSTDTLEMISDFSLPNEKGDIIYLFSIPHKWSVLFFYPKDMTPGCTVESKDFSKLKNEFDKLDIQIFGISADDTHSHAKFCQKELLNISLLADTEKVVCNQFGVWQKKVSFGKESFGIVRSTFLIDIAHKKILKSWRSVTVQNHAQDVLSFAQKNCK